MSGLSPLHANIVKRHNIAATIAGMGGMALNANLAHTGTLARNEWFNDAQREPGIIATNHQMMAIDDKGSTDGKYVSQGCSKNQYLT